MRYKRWLLEGSTTQDSKFEAIMPFSGRKVCFIQVKVSDAFHLRFIPDHKHENCIFRWGDGQNLYFEDGCFCLEIFYCSIAEVWGHADCLSVEDDDGNVFEIDFMADDRQSIQDAVENHWYKRVGSKWIKCDKHGRLPGERNPLMDL